MRTWILELVPDYEQGTRYGVFSSPLTAWDALFETVESHIFKASVDEFSVFVGGDPHDNPQDPARDILLRVEFRSGDRIDLAGAHVQGTEGKAPTVSDWRDLQQVGGLLRAHAVQQAGFECADKEPCRLPTGTWNFRRRDEF